MFRDEFKERYTTIPVAIYQAHFEHRKKEGLPHQHKEAELIAVTEGSADFYIDGQLYPMEKGDVLIISPYAIHSAAVSGHVNTSYYCICFDLSILSDEELKNGLEDNTLWISSPLVKKMSETKGTEGKINTRALTDYIEKAFHACEKKEMGWELTATGNLSLLFGLLKSYHFFEENLLDKKEKQFGKQAMDYINTHFAEEITSRSAAEALFLNQSYFCRLFKKNFGFCFAEYLTAYRLEKARIYLANTNMPISEIIFLTGFHSSSYFGKVFKARFGLTPLVYRRMKKQKEGIHR